ncbi:hypothetical protein BISA_0072 [Bifidobacterium saguini DSM 23967]|uniref:Uncharacterized protein n=1 Tax=Bifidobacterium saguini DSM 23967 TaxID=1437607 RepID=A0A087DET7_9BIFI|nr:hypothetical protein BISA_0072 [Bifidobacterium saguini DSM 23967]
MRGDAIKSGDFSQWIALLINHTDVQHSATQYRAQLEVNVIGMPVNNGKSRLVAVAAAAVITKVFNANKLVRTSGADSIGLTAICGKRGAHACVPTVCMNRRIRAVCGKYLTMLAANFRAITFSGTVDEMPEA